jgi:hypothetical protein
MGSPDDSEINIQRRTRALNVHPDAPVRSGLPITNEDVIEKAGKAVEPLTATGAPRTAAAKRNKSHELVTEVAATDWVKHNYGPRAKLRGVLQRANGVPVFDLVFETGRKQFLVVEAKSFFSELGFTNDHVYVQAPDGKLHKVTLAGEVEQMSGRWFDQKFDEMRFGRDATRSSQKLANELHESARSGGLRALVLRARPKPSWITAGGIAEGLLSTEVLFEIVDYTAELCEHFGVESTHVPPKGTEVGSTSSGTLVSKGVSTPGRSEPERKLAVDVAMLDDEHRKALGRAKTLKEGVTKATNKVTRAKAALTKARDEFESAPKSKAKKRDVEAAKAKVKAAQDGVRQAREAARDAKQHAGLIGKRLASKRRIAKLASARAPRPQRVAPPPAPLPSPTRPTPQDRSISASNKVTPEERAVHGKDSHHRGVPGKSVAIGAPVSPPSGAGRIRRAGRVVMGKAKMLVRLGARLLPILDVVDGLLMVVSAIDYVVAWLQREKTAERDEWTRIAHFLSWAGDRTRLSPYDVEYIIGFGDSASQLVQSILTGAGPGNLENWLHKWETEEGWRGFVYATITVNLTRSALGDSDLSDPYLQPYSAESVRPAPPFSDADLARVKRIMPGYEMEVKQFRDYPVTYDIVGRMEIFPTHAPLPNTKKEGTPVYKSEQDEGNRRVTNKVREAGYQQGKGVAVEVRPLWVRYTYPTPILTPFDFIIAKVNNLVAAIIAFVSTHDENVAPDQEVRMNVMGYAWNLFGEYDHAPAPLWSPAIKASLEAIHTALTLLSTHVTEAGDSQLPNPPQKHNRGLLRRREILQKLVKGDATIDEPNRPRKSDVVSFSQIASQYVYNICQTDAAGPFVTGDPEVDTLTVSALCDFAQSIHEDIVRAHNATRATLELNYSGPAPGLPTSSARAANAQASARSPTASPRVEGSQSEITDRERGLA